MSESGVEHEHDETEARVKRREKRFNYRGGIILRAARRELSAQATRLRDEERQARKRHADEDADGYRKAANACEDALAEIEAVLPEVDRDV